MISPWREVRYSPGSDDSTRQVSWPCARLPPWCGQRFDSAKNSPPRLNSTMARPFTSTRLRVPGAISPTLATTCLAIALLLVLLPVAGTRDVGHRDAAVDRLAARLLSV